jgi:hypothetical protein
MDPDGFTLDRADIERRAALLHDVADHALDGQSVVAPCCCSFFALTRPRGGET